MFGDAEQEVIREKLRRHALRFAAAINANPAAWSAETAWLKHLPSCQTVRFTNDPNHPALTDGRFIEENPDAPDGHREFLYDDEAETVRRSGPICRKLSEGWQAAIYRFRERFTDRYYDFGVRDAKRIALLTALILNRDFDGEVVGLGWPWDQPEEKDTTFNCRGWSWALLTTGLFAEEAILDHAARAEETLIAHELMPKWAREEGTRAGALAPAPAPSRAGPEPTPTRPVVLDDTASKILGALRTATASGKGLTLKELVSQVGVSEQSTVSRGIDRLRGMGAVIDNSLGGRGYVLVKDLVTAG